MTFTEWLIRSLNLGYIYMPEHSCCKGTILMLWEGSEIKDENNGYVEYKSLGKGWFKRLDVKKHVNSFGILV